MFENVPDIALQSFVNNGSEQNFKMDYIHSLQSKIKNWPLKLVLEELYDIQHPLEVSYEPERGFYDDVRLIPLFKKKHKLLFNFLLVICFKDIIWSQSFF